MHKTTITDAILWAAAILAGALMGADPFYVTIVLPILAVVALAPATRGTPPTRCRPEVWG